ncbi:MAG: hypothetical protein GWQ05_21610 [Verrucomicrobiaceae bacterium]|nr:hypothetical protein [Verrucomicrobiaceae bacterium]
MWHDAQGIDTLINEWPINVFDRFDVNTHLTVVLPHPDEALPTKLLKQVSLAESVQVDPVRRSTLSNQFVSSFLVDQMLTPPLSYCLWIGSFLVLALVSANMVFREQSQQTLTILLTTSIPSAALMKLKA